MSYKTLVDLFTEMLSAATAIVTVITVIEEYMHKRSARSSGYRWVRRGKELIAAEYLEVLRRSNLADSGLNSRRLMKRLSRDSLVEVIESYVAIKCARILSPLVRKLRIICLNSLAAISLLCALRYLNSLAFADQVNRNISILVTLAIIYGAYVLLLILQMFAAIVCRVFYLVQSTRMMISRSVEPVALSTVRSYVARGDKFVFVDATLRSEIVMNGRPAICDSESLLELSGINDDKVVLLKTEYQQSRRGDYEDLVGRIVKSYVNNRFDKDASVVCFVYSEFGLTSVEVTYALKNIGMTAYCIGKSDGCEIELSRIAAETVLLRECGLL